MSEIICTTGYYGIFDHVTNRFILGIQQTSPTKAMHKLRCKVSESVISTKTWTVEPIFENHKNDFFTPLKWKGINIRTKQIQMKKVNEHERINSTSGTMVF